MDVAGYFNVWVVVFFFVFFSFMFSEEENRLTMDPMW